MDTRPTRWVSCGRDVEWSVGRYRHLTYQMDNNKWVTTFCGATGTPGALRTNSRKPKCPVCVEIESATATRRVATGSSNPRRAD